MLVKQNARQLFIEVYHFRKKKTKKEEKFEMGLPGIALGPVDSKSLCYSNAGTYWSCILKNVTRKKNKKDVAKT